MAAKLFHAPHLVTAAHALQDLTDNLHTLESLALDRADPVAASYAVAARHKVDELVAALEAEYKSFKATYRDINGEAL